MDRNKKLSKILFATVTTLALASGAFAIPQGPCDPKPNPIVCCEEPPPGPFAFAFPKDLSLSCPKDFYFDAAFLLMQAREDGLEYSIKQSFIANPPPADKFPLQNGTVQGFTTPNKSSNWNYGVRLTAGFYLNHDTWDLQAAWTYFRINNDKGMKLNGGFLLPLWIDPGIDAVGNNYTASARWTANLNTLDLSLGKPYHVSRYVILNPYFGVRFGWINQDFLTRNGGIFSDAANNTANNLDMIASNDFWGVGTRAGLNSEWYVGLGWYLFGQCSAALLYSHFDVEQSVTFLQAVRTEVDHDFYTVVPCTDIKLGLCWNHRFCCNKYLMRLSLAYEFHAWFDQNRLRRFFDDTKPQANDSVSRADLYLSGFAFNAGFNF